jgi:putative oxidoreductase
MSFLTALEPQLYALMRIVTGFLFFWHGSQKILGFPASPHEAPAFIKWLAGGIELVGGALILIGLQTRPVAFLCSGLMAVAYWMAHGLPGGIGAPLPLQNGGELAVIYCFVFLFIAARGAGIWSVDGEGSTA